MNPGFAALAGGILGAALGAIIAAFLVWLLALRPVCASLAALRRALADMAAGRDPEATAGPEAAALARQLAEARGLGELRRRLQSLRHDLRGALSPAMLSADRLTTHADEKVRRAANVVMSSLERSTALLADPAHKVAAADDAPPQPEL